jgi:hypothetical protein
MSDSDKSLKILIDLGFIGQDQAAAAKKALDDFNQSTKSTTELAQQEIERSKELIVQRQRELEVLKALERQRAELTAAGQSTAEVDNAIGRLNRSLNGSSHHFNSARINSELFRISMMALGAYMPGLETALYAALSAGEASFLGIMGALLAFENEMKSLNETAEIQQVAFKGDADAIAAVETATEKADIAARLFIEDMVRQNAAGATAADVANRITGSYRNLIAAQSDLDKAQKAVGEASIEALEKNGVLTHKQALEEKFKLDVFYAQRKLNLDGWLHQQEEAAKRQQLETEKQQLQAALEDQKTDQATAKKAEQEKARHDARLQTAKDNLASAQKTLDELGKSHGAIIKGQINDDNVQKLTEYYEKYIGSSANVSLSDQFLKLQQAMKTVTNKASWDFGLTELLDREIGSQNLPALAKYEGAHQQLSSARKELAALGKTQFDVDLNAQRAAKQLSATDDAVRNLQASVNKLSSEIPKLVADHAAKQANDVTAANLNLTAEAVKNGLQPPGNPLTPPPRAAATTSWPVAPNGTATPPITNENDLPWPQRPETKARSDFSQFESAFGILSSGGRLDQSQMQYMQHIAQMMSGHEVKADKMLAFMREVLTTNNHRNAAFERELNVLRNQLHSSVRTGHR